MKLALSLLITLTFVVASPVAAQDNERRSTYTQVKHLRLIDRADGQPSKPGLYAQWRGQVWLEGVLVVEFDRAEGSETKPELGSGFVSFEPNATSLRKLPRAVGHFYPAKPTNLLVHNAQPVPILALLIGAAEANDLARGNMPRVELEVRILLTRLGTSIDCDHRNYGMHYTQIRIKPKTLVALADEAKNIGC